MSYDLQGHQIRRHYFVPNIIRAFVTIGVVGLTLGCSTLHYGGAPEPSFNIKKDLKQLANQFKDDSIINFYKDPSVTSRDRFITGRLTLMNIRYIQFIRTLTSERQLLDSAADMLTLALSLAGTSVSGAGTKTVLAAIAAGVTGSKQVIDKNYYFEKTIPALVGQMNAERKKALIPILFGMKGNLDEYPFEKAVTDLHNYYHAGTFSGAIQAIQADAGAKEQQKDRVIATLAPMTAAQVDEISALTKAIGSLVVSDLPNMKKAIEELEPSVKGESLDFDSAKEKLQDFVFNARKPEDMARVKEVFMRFKILRTQ